MADDDILPIDPKKLEQFIKRSHDIQVILTYYRCAMMEVETKFRVLDAELSLANDRNPIESIKTRLKSNVSIYEKLLKRRLPLSAIALEHSISDIAGVRVICSFVDDVYLLADALLRQDDITLIERKDYIKSPKENGYRSLHLIVSVPIFLSSEKKDMKVEIQLRTIAMDFWASLEHQLRYKKDVEISDEVKNGLYVCAEESAQLDKRMQHLRSCIDDISDIEGV